MKRRDFLKVASLIGIAIVLGACSKGPSPATKRKPNIIYILADDLGYGDLSCYGQTRFKTPISIRLQSRAFDSPSTTPAVPYALRRDVPC